MVKLIVSSSMAATEDTCTILIFLQVGRVFTPIDAVSIAAKAVLQTDLRRAARKVVDWLDANS